MNSRIPQILRLCSHFYSPDSSKRKALLHQLEELGENSNHPIFNWSSVMHWIHYVPSSLPYTDCSVRASVQSSAQLGSNSAGLKRKKQKQKPQQKSKVPQSQWAWETPEAGGKRPTLPPASGPARRRFLPLPRPPLPTPRPAPPLGLGSPGGGRMAIPGGWSRWMPWRRYEAVPRGGTGGRGNLQWQRRVEPGAAPNVRRPAALGPQAAASSPELVPKQHCAPTAGGSPPTPLHKTSATPNPSGLSSGLQPQYFRFRHHHARHPVPN